VLVERRVQDLDGVAAVEGRPAREHLEQHGARGEEVAPRVEAVAGHLLRRHVARRAHQHARAGQLAGRAGGGQKLRDDRPRQPEVEQLDAVRRQEDVRRLQVAVHDAARVQGRKRLEDLERDGQRLRHAQRSPLQPLRKRLAFEELHRYEQLPAVLADLVQVADVRGG
jgi:hypothetical protein